jgi:hypothetical protein
VYNPVAAKLGIGPPLLRDLFFALQFRVAPDHAEVKDLRSLLESTQRRPAAPTLSFSISGAIKRGTNRGSLGIEGIPKIWRRGVLSRFA